MSSKLQFLDPITVACRIAFLKLNEPYDPKTKIRISNHVIELVPSNYVDIVYRTYNHLIHAESREDLCALFPVIVRYIEHHLCRKIDMDDTESDHVDMSTQSVSLIDLSHGESKKSEIEPSFDECQKYLKKIAYYMIEGFHVLQKTYDYDNAVFVIQCFINLLRAGIDGTYTRTMLPQHLKDYTTQNLFDVSKIKKLWNDKEIIHIGKLFESCFNAKDETVPDAVSGYMAAINIFLKSRDDEFKKLVSQAENA